MKPKKVYFRADGHAKMGLGHVIRTLALADMLKDHYQCIFLIRNPLAVLIDQIEAVCPEWKALPLPLSDEEEAKELAANVFDQQDLIVLDGYHFDTRYQKILKTAGCRLLCIDDIHAFHFVADVVINHAPGLCQSDYSTAYYTQLCLGLDYSLLRAPFLEAAKKPRVFGQVDTAFICFGGSDFNNLSLKVLRALTDQDWIKKVHLVLGGANANRPEIEAFIGQSSRTDIRLHSNLNAQEMVTVMQDAQLAIVPASSILYEAVAVNMIIISGYYVDNQVEVYQGFLGLGLIHGLGDFNHFENYAEKFNQVKAADPRPWLERQHRHIYGQSKEHFLELFRQLEDNPNRDLQYRLAEEEDLMCYFNWANEPAVRRQSLSQATISLEDHRKWFMKKLARPTTLMYLFFWKERPVGQVRFELEDQSAVINYALDASMRGKGLGKKMLSQAMNILEKETPLPFHTFLGVVKRDNAPSVKIFEKLGFNVQEERTIQGADCLVYTRKRYKKE